MEYVTDEDGHVFCDEVCEDEFVGDECLYGSHENQDDPLPEICCNCEALLDE